MEVEGVEESVEAVISPNGHTEAHRHMSLLFCLEDETKTHNLDLASKLALMTSMDEEDVVDCPLCINPMKNADVQFKMHCPTASCEFNMCSDCIVGMLKSEASGFEEASDGSRQVKYHIACPSCRARYVAPESQIVPAEEEKKDQMMIAHLTKPGRDFHPVVGCVLILREARVASKLLLTDDSELSASELKAKYNFIEETTLSDLKEAAINYEMYLKRIGKYENNFYELDWDDFAVLPRSMEGSALSKRQAKMLEQPWRDPTLFMGLEELMSLYEQEFVTKLMCSKNTNNLAQAAQIMHGVLNATGSQRSSSLAGQEPPAPLNPKEAQKLKGRFPLPNHMPRCVVIPVYNPNSRDVPLKFESISSKNPNPLTLAQVRGIAGRSGLRRGDVITHLHAEPMESHEHFVGTVDHLYQSNPKDELLVIVNCHADTAEFLFERMQNMQKAKVKF